MDPAAMSELISLRIEIKTIQDYLDELRRTYVSNPVQADAHLKPELRKLNEQTIRLQTFLRFHRNELDSEVVSVLDTALSQAGEGEVANERVFQDLKLLVEKNGWRQKMAPAIAKGAKFVRDLAIDIIVASIKN